VVVGTVTDPDMGDHVRVTIVATGFDKPSVLKQQTIERSTQPETSLSERDNSEYLDIPTFLRRQSTNENLAVPDAAPKKIKDTHTMGCNIKIVTPEDTPDADLAELISHLSNVYRSVGGDELIIGSVSSVPPNPNISAAAKRSKIGTAR
jgi:hypothetical protein